MVNRAAHSANANLPVNPERLLSLAVGEHTILRDPGEFCLQFPAATSGGSYLMGITATREINAITSWRFSTVTPASGVAMASHNGVSTSVAPEAKLRAWERSFLASSGSRAVATPSAAALRMRRPPPVVGQNISFRVPRVSIDPCNLFDLQPATVVHVGTGLVIAIPEASGADINALLVVPGLDQTIAEMQASAAVINEMVSSYTGDFIQQFDDDGLLTVLLTDVTDAPAVFGTMTDLLPVTTCPASNSQAMVYLAVSSPDYTHPTQAAAAIMASIGGAAPALAHEVAHLAQHGVRLGAGVATALPAWLSEGQAELVVEMVGRALLGDGNAQDLGWSTVNADQSARDWYLPRFESLSHHFGWDGACGKVAGAPAMCSLFGFGVGGSPCDPAGGSGAAWSLLRYISDRIAGQSPQGMASLLRLLVRQVNLDAIATTLAGMSLPPLPDLLAEWAMSLYTDGRIPDTGNLRFRSWDMADIFGALAPAQRLDPVVLPFGQFDVQGNIIGGGTAYLRLDAGGAHGSLAVKVSDATGAGFAESMVPRVWVVRLQ
ncbi:MAG TPA: hypothetical protein PLL69_08830, partial [Gemmatimonadales bacterium]|nr:hypothetical protein [Gemmatimonadales bacterium]